jgi:putative transposase
MLITTADAAHRKSHTHLGELYFWTSTIRNWIPLLTPDSYKQLVIDSLAWLSKKELIAVYGFVIMPNHVHLLWQQLRLNGKELPKNSFEKFTAHQFKILLQHDNPALLSNFKTETYDRSFNFWQRDPLAIRVFNKAMCIQKLNYIHNNPLQEQWRLSTEPEQYHFSSAAFYEKGDLSFPFLKHYTTYFDG